MKFIIKDKKIFYAGLTYFLCLLLFIGFRVLWGTGIFKSLDPIVGDLLFSVFVQILAFTLLPFLFYKTLTKQTFRQVCDNFFIKKVNGKTIFYSILTGILVYIIILFVSSFWTTLITIFGYSSKAATVTSNLPVWLAFLISIISTSLLPGFGEEVVHRGMTIGGVKQNGVKRAVLLSALLFGLAHLNIAQFGYAFVVGLILGTVTLTTRSIFPAMIIHATSNFCSIYMSFAQSNGWWLGDTLANFLGFITSNWFAGLMVCFLLIFTVITLLVMLLMRFYTQSKMQKFKNFCDNLRKITAGTPVGEQIDFNDKIYLLTLYQQAAAKDFAEKLENGSLSREKMQADLNKSPIVSIMNPELDNFSPPHALDYLFYYLSIFLATVVTIMTFIWGVL